MTENELKKIIAIYKKTLEVTADNGETCFRELDKNTLLFLEELQQYRAIGTVEDIRNTHLLCEVFSSTVRDYTTIGTVEEFKILKENERKCQDCAGCTNWKCDCANERAYAIDEFIEKLRLKCLDSVYKEIGLHTILEIAEQMKAGRIEC